MKSKTEQIQELEREAQFLEKEIDRLNTLQTAVKILNFGTL